MFLSSRIGWSVFVLWLSRNAFFHTATTQTSTELIMVGMSLRIVAVPGQKHFPCEVTRLSLSHTHARARRVVLVEEICTIWMCRCGSVQISNVKNNIEIVIISFIGTCANTPFNWIKLLYL